MNSELLKLLFMTVFGAILLVISWLESLLSVPRERWLGQDNVFIIAPVLLIIGLPLYMAARRKYVLQPHPEKRSVALLSVAALGIFIVVPTAIIGVRTNETVVRFCTADVAICYSFLTYQWMRDALRRTREQ